VGNKSTPNTTAQSAEAIECRKAGRPSSNQGDPAQLTHCPWCGSEIKPGENIVVDQGRGRTFLYCGDALGRCLFSNRRSENEGLPVVVVDEEIYRLLPSLLIGTVDKFAQMPWNGVTQMLFGRVNGFCTRHGFRSPELEDADSHPPTNGKGRGISAVQLAAAKTIPHGPLRPPDLIVQDELHLISGPLGSLVGLYETAVDYLCSWEVDGKRVRPKVIASTATIRNARQQVHRTFLRQVSVFPPHGLDVDDNFFARQRPNSEEEFGRLYLGVCAPGARLKEVLIRVYLACLSGAQTLYEKYGAEADPWMTLVGYFNSMRELGGTRRLVDDAIRSGLHNMDRRGLKRRSLRRVDELTSRRSSAEIPRILTEMERRFGLPASENGLPLDVLLATNMLSVGVDVARLGLMVVANQPKTTAEYIQATSRVGRTFPGLVCTVLNGSRPRDLSHYEQFEQYHGTFYQFVEALSVTPFAPRALDRGLAALLVSCIRLAGTEFNGNHDAGKLERDHPLVQAALNAIAVRACEVEESAEARDRVRRSLEARLDSWLAQIQRLTGGARLAYQGKRKNRDGLTIALLQET
jgi:hypothetical protein